MSRSTPCSGTWKPIRARIGLVVCAVLVAMAAYDTAAQTVGTCSPALGEAYLDIGNVRARILNNGNLFFRGEPHVYNIPKGLPSNAIFASGVWIGGMVDGTLRMAANRYGPHEFWPGPLDEAGNPPFDCGLYDRLYKVSKADVEAYEATGAATPDLADWPTGLGAPTVDAAGHEIDLSGQPLAARRGRVIDLAAGERPSFLGDQMIWWVMNDLGNTHASSGGEPIGIEVQALAFAFDEPGPVGNATFYRYTIAKKGVSPLEDAYIGLFSDPDLGDSADDWIGSDSTLGLGYVWNSDNFDGGSEGYGTPPPAVGYDVFQGALVESPGSNARAGPREVPGFKNVPVTTVLVYNNGGGVHEDPSVAADYYHYMRGLWKDGGPITVGGWGYDPNGQATRFHFSGDAANCAYWTECNSDGQGSSNDPFDRRFVSASGPFTVEAGGRQEILWGIVYGRGNDNFDSVTALKEADVALQRFVDSWFTEFPDVTDLAPTVVPELVSPADWATNQPLGTTLWWSCPEGAPSCRMELALDPEFHDVVRTSTETRLDVSLEADRTYWWHAAALGRHEVLGPWSPVRSFRTGQVRFGSVIRAFSIVSNAAGPVDPPACGSFQFNSSGFPADCGGDRPPVGSQATNSTQWGIHAGGARIPFGPQSDPTSYLGRSWGTREATCTVTTILPYDYEWRFTARGGKAVRLYDGGDVIEVPFELWRTGIGTPDDPADDMRLVPAVCETACGAGTVAGRFDAGGDHAISGGVNDPTTDWVDWLLPEDETPGEAGYEAYFAGTGSAREIMARQVLVCFNCGAAPPYPAPHPEEGTTYRITTRMPEVPVLAAPSSGATLPADGVRLFWSGPAELAVAVQVSAEAFFQDLVVSREGALSGDMVAIPEPGGYFWRAGSERFGWSETWALNVIGGTAAEAGTDLPTEFSLDPAYPNPFNPTTTIRYALPTTSPVLIEVFDVLGRRVATLVDEPALGAGFHEIRLDLSRLAGGVYLVAMRAGSSRQARPIVLLR